MASMAVFAKQGFEENKREKLKSKCRHPLSPTKGRIVWSKLEEQVTGCFNCVIIPNGRGLFHRPVYRTEESLWIV